MSVAAPNAGDLSFGAVGGEFVIQSLQNQEIVVANLGLVLGAPGEYTMGSLVETQEPIDWVATIVSIKGIGEEPLFEDVPVNAMLDIQCYRTCKSVIHKK